MQGKAKGESKQAEVRRKLAQSGISKPEEFQEIISNLITQREKLEGDLQTLREKVVALQQKQARKQTRPHRNHPKSSHAILNQRQELSRKYEQLKQWQKRSSKAMKTTATNSEYRAYLDKIFNIQQQIQVELKNYNDQKNTYTKLKKALKALDREDEKNSNVQEGIERENHLLKKRIGSLKKIVDRQMVKEIELQTCLIDMKEKEREGQQRQYIMKLQGNRIRQDSRARSRHRDSAIRNKTEGIRPVTVSDVSSDDIEVEEEISLDFYPGQMTTKDQVFQLQGYLNRLENRYQLKVEAIQRQIKQNYPYQKLSQLRSGSKLTFAKEFDLTLEHCKGNLSLLHESNKQKIHLLLEKIDNNLINYTAGKDIGYTSTSLVKGIQDQANFYSKSRSARKLKSIVGEQKTQGHEKLTENVQEKILYPRTYEERSMQTDVSVYNDPNPLRREFVGTLSESRADDRHLLGSQKNSSIKTLHIYYSDRGIASIKAIYTLNPSSETLQGKSFLPDSFLSNYCKVHTISTSAEDFIRYFKLRYNFLQARITSLKIVTNRNMKNGWGDHKIKSEQRDIDQQIEKDYIFDINKDQFPVSIVSSHVQKGPYWYLCGFGVEINQL